jgi:hypothetical protein
MSKHHQSERRTERRDNKKSKRGVILLVVVSLLTLMVLIGVTFVLFANRSLTAARVDQSRNEYREPPEKMFEQVVGQLIYDTVSRSALRGHSLLEDLYGPDFIAGTVANITPTGVNPNNDNGDQWPSDNNPLAAPRGQAFAFQFNTTPINQHAPILDYYSGRVITFTSGNAGGYSSRILQYDPTVNPPRLHIEAIESSQSISVVPGAGDTFVINGAPFNGVGAGFDDYNGVNPPNPLTAAVLNISAVYGDVRSIDTTVPPAAPRLAPPPTDLVALLPHFNGYDPLFGRVYKGVGTPTGQTAVAIDQGLALGGFDEPWDAPDYQNMYLAMQPAITAVMNTDTDPANNVPMFPSFHRPDLVNYWVAYMITSIFVPAGVGNTNGEQFEIMAQPYGADHIRDNADDDTPVPRSTLPIEQRDRIYNITRCSIFRPMPWDHPNFTGSNAALTGLFSSAVPANPPARIQNAQQLFAVLTGRGLTGAFNQNLYDVDNDNDSLPDSIWLDVGLPVVTTPDGKRIKRLVAIMVQDLDGRIDMNAHGNLGQIYPRAEVPPASGQFHLPTRPQYRLPGTLGINFGLTLGPPGNNTPIFVPRGVGFGPAEVDFLNLLIPPTHTPPGPTTAFQVDPALGGPTGPVMSAVASYENILRGRYTSNLPGDVWPVVPPVVPANQFVGAQPGAPGPAGAFEPLNQIKHHGVPNDFATWGSWYASPPDVWGRGAVVLDWGGQPVYAPFAIAAPPVVLPAQPNGEMQDNPYELSLSGQVTNTDSPYTLVELERILRYHDYDSQRLQSRPLLPEAQGGAGSILAANPPGIIGPDHTARQRMSGRTAYLPASSGQLPGTQIVTPTQAAQRNSPDGSWRTIASAGGKHAGNTTILDMYAGKIVNIGGLGVNTPQYLETLNDLIPWELRHGGKFDLNRWLGNGFDAQAPNADGVADDPVEAIHDPANGPPFGGAREHGWLQPPAFANVATTSPADHTNGTDANNDGISAPAGSSIQRAADRMLARQLYARHLYCLATLFIDPTFDPRMPHEPAIDTPPLRPQRQELFARRIAQWAINVVDYRDSDAIMTPFEYDINPWNGWHVDSNLLTDGSTNALEVISLTPGAPAQPYQWPGPNGPQGNERRLVWGCEQPDLIISENIAFHSRNVKDTDVAGMTDMKRTDPNTTDDTLDQFRVPQGSLFVEFYCPRPYRWQSPAPQFNQQANQKPRYPLELYDANGFLQLARLAPPRPGENLGRPVWRMALAPLLNDEDANDPFKAVHPQTLAGARNDRGQAQRESGSFDWQDTSLLTYPDGAQPPAPVGPLNQFRYAYFGPLDINTVPPLELAHSFFNRVPNSFPLLAPGGYAVLGPRPMTHLGSYTPSAPPLLWDTGVGSFNGYSDQRIELNPTAAPNVCAVYDTNNALTSRTPATFIRDVVTVVADYQANPISGGMPWANNRLWTSGLNITEPLMNDPGTNYYPEPADPASLTTPNLPPDAGFYDDPDPAVSGATALFPDDPVEGSDASNAGRPIHENEMQNTGTYEDVSSMYLQRLANPNLPWNPLPSDPVFGVNGQIPSFNGNLLINPYITVDWASIDVTVFAGDEDTDQEGSDMMPLDPDDPDPTNTAPEMAFRSRQRAFHQGYGPYPPGSQSPWSPITENLADAGPYAATTPNAAAPGNPYFDFDLSNDLDPIYTAADRHTLGYLNAGLGYPAPPQGPVPPPPFVRAYMGEPTIDSALGQPEPAPFPWLTFANRPFANPYELLMVPASAPSRLALEVTPGHLGQDNMNPPVNTPAAQWGSNPNPYDFTNAEALRKPFGHLLNFFHTEDTGPKQTPPALSPHFQRMFDYIEVPSPYASAERWFNPSLGHFDNAGLYRPPFNKLSRFRDAGRININTIFDDQILISAMGQFPGLDTFGSGSFADKLFRSRQGYGALGSAPFAMDPAFPTIFANPFRPLDAADQMPDIPASQFSMRKSGILVSPGVQRAMPVDATFFRADPDAPPPPQPPASPRNRLFDQIADTATFGATGVNQFIYRDTERNPYFRYQVMQKLGNTFSTNSNVFAVWMTIGYFEVEDNRYDTNGAVIVDAAHPDGLRLGPEIGADSGEIVRHRAFYIIDRSVPVGHVPGQKLNAENCILLRRMIE